MPEEVKLKPLTKKQLKFVACWEGNNTEAARKAGLPFPNVSGAKMMTHPAVKAAVDEKKKAIAAATQAVVVAAGKELGTSIGIAITRDAIAQRAWAIAQAAADNMGMFTSQVNALKFLSELLKYTGDEGRGGVTIVNQPQVYQSQWVRDGSAPQVVEGHTLDS